MEPASAPGASGGLERLELRIERLDVTFRFTFAFHAREVRFERDESAGFERIFPETFSFHAQRHDPAELFLQLDDLLRKSRLLSPKAHRRDVVELVTRLLSEAPRYLERVCERVEREGRLDPERRMRFHQDVALLAQILLRFLETSEIGERRPVRIAGFLLRKIIFRSLYALLQGRVDPEYMQRYVKGEVDPVSAADDPSESGFFHTLEAGKSDVVNRIVVRMAERNFYLWLGVCLDEENQAFEKEDSPFDEREVEVLRAVLAAGDERIQRGEDPGSVDRIQRGEDLTPFLRRPSRDCRRMLAKLETWFLHQYDIQHSSAVIYHAACLERGRDDAQQTLSWHTPRIHLTLLALLAAPFVAAVFAYERAPVLFDLVCAAEALVVIAAAVWFLAYRFVWKRDLTFFHASVPRIVAGVIVGYLPVFLIDEVWDLAERSALTLLGLGLLLGSTTLLYIYVEVERRLGNSLLAFARARAIFVLGVLEAFGVGVVMTSLVGRHMVSRNWSPEAAGALPIETLRATLDPLVGELPRIVGLEPFYVFPSALLMMTFLSFFIGIFLQLMWEALPITEPL